MENDVIILFDRSPDARQEMKVQCPDCAGEMVGVDGRWICCSGRHARAMEPLVDAIREERAEWERFESLLAVACSERPMDKAAKRALGDQMVEHIKRGKYLAWVISLQGEDYSGNWWAR